MRDLNEIMIFSRVAQFGSFSGAAKSLGVPVSMVSRKISDLESRLGILLIKRTTRKLSLTEEGSYLFENCATQVHEIEEAELNLTKSKSDPQGLLKVTVPMTLGRGPFLDFVSDFMKKYPGIEVDLNITNLYVDLVTGDIDVAIRFGDLPSAGVIAKKLGVSRRCLAASPEYLRKRGTPANIQDLKNHDCILFQSRGSETTWELLNGRTKNRVTVKGKLSANNFETVNEMTIRGHGIAFLTESYVIAGLADRSLKRVLPQWGSAPVPVHALYLSRKLMPRKLEVFLDEISRWESAVWKT